MSSAQFDMQLELLSKKPKSIQILILSKEEEVAKR